MVESSERSVLLVGQSQRVQELLARAVRQCGALAESFAAWKDCASFLHGRGCRLLVIDVDGEATNVFRMVAESREMLPQTPVLVLVERGDMTAAVGAMKAGAADCLEKPVETERLCSTIEVLLRGGGAAGPDIGAVLTRTECLVLTYILKGKTNRETADILHRSPRTIEVHRQGIMRKLGASNVVDLFKRAGLMGLMAPRP